MRDFFFGFCWICSLCWHMSTWKLMCFNIFVHYLHESVLTFYSLVVSVRLQKSSMTFTLHNVFVQILEQTASFTLDIIKWLVLFHKRGGDCLLYCMYVLRPYVKHITLCYFYGVERTNESLISGRLESNAHKPITAWIKCTLVCLFNQPAYLCNLCGQ